MRPRVPLTAWALVLLALPAVQAEDAQSPLAITSIGVCNPQPIPYGGNGTCSISIGVGCKIVVESVAARSDHTATVALIVQDPPAWLTATASPIVLDPKGCPSAGQAGYLTVSGILNLSVTPEAPGVVQQNFVVEARMPGITQVAFNATQSGNYNVSYRAAHTVTPNIQFPFKMTGRTLNFTVTVTNEANARSMVMFENVRASAGSVAGLASVVYEPPETKTFQVTYTAPNTEWKEAKITFHNYSHFLLNGTSLSGGPNLASDESWTVVNGNPAGDAETTKAAPFSAASAMVMLALAALVAGRRKASE